MQKFWKEAGVVFTILFVREGIPSRPGIEEIPNLKHQIPNNIKAQNINVQAV
jgi:hypothetical protein